MSNYASMIMGSNVLVPDPAGPLVMWFDDLAIDNARSAANNVRAQSSGKPHHVESAESFGADLVKRSESAKSDTSWACRQRRSGSSDAAMSCSRTSISGCSSLAFSSERAPSSGASRFRGLSS